MSDSLFIVGGDTLRMNPWLQGGKRFGTTGSFGTMDNNHIDFYTNGQQRGRWANTGNLLIGNGPDNGYKLQLHDKGSVVFSPTLSRPNDFIIFGGYMNPDDGQNMIISTSDGTTGHAVLMERDGNIGMGWGSPTGWKVGHPTFRIDANGTVSIASTRLYFGETGGPINSSGLVTSVSNGNEWQGGWSYPNGANYYYFGTTLQGATAGNSRAPLRIGAKTLTFLTGPAEPEGVEALRITDSGRIGIGTITPSAQLHTTGSVRFAGLTNNNSLTRIVVCDATGNLYYKDAASTFNGTLNSDLAINGAVAAQKC